MMLWKIRFGWLAGGLLLAGTAVAADLPACLTRAAGETTRAAVMKIAPAHEELLARLAYAEGRSTGFPDDPRVYQGIAWGVINRVRLGEISAAARRQYGNGVAGVIFQPHQFNPAVSLRSPFSKDFLCPQDATRWRLAVDAAGTALRGQDNPLIETPWEQRNGRSLVVNFYYPQSSQARGPLAPWEGSRALRFIGDPPPGSGLPPAERIRFYRLVQPPGDLLTR
ncbi:MAG TPA: cell wall hydrolase [Candidatus Contendobacter sp.]|nr:cell wall hydrolase [Candidatus Contendobacter sp.]